MHTTGTHQIPTSTRSVDGPANDRYDVVVVGARAAGAATAMLLARRGLSVLAVDRSAYGSDTISTHSLSRSGVLLLSRWGVLDRIRDAGTPVTRALEFHFGDDPVRLDVPIDGDVDGMYSPRRTLLDAALVDEARRSGAEVCHGVAVQGITRDPSGRVDGVEMTVGRTTRVVKAGFVVGADGARSRVAAAVGAATMVEGLTTASYIVGYRTGLPSDVMHTDISRKGSVFGIVPTNDELACVWVGMTPERFRRDVRGNLGSAYAAEVERSPGLRKMLRGTEQVGRLRGWVGTPGFLREAHGPGWALVGDAGYLKDPISAHGITDAFVGAELLSAALAETILDGADEGVALGRFQQQRDRLASRLLPSVSRLAGLDLDGADAAAAFIDMSAALKQEWAFLTSGATSPTPSLVGSSR